MPGGPARRALELEAGFCETLEHVTACIFRDTLLLLEKPDELLEAMINLEAEAEQATSSTVGASTQWLDFKSQQLKRNEGGARVGMANDFEK
jgi:hypothetical protein